MNILFAASEAVPFAASGGLADVIGSLPAAIREKGHDCRVVIPLYKTMRPELRAQLTFLTNITVDVSWRKQYCGIFTAIWCGVTYYFIDNEYYFGREGLYGFYDDCERFVFFSRAVLEMLRYIDFKPDIINGNDWQTALIPVFYQVFYKYQQGYQDIKHVFTIHNIQYQGVYGMELIGDVLGLPQEAVHLVEYNGCVNLMKGAIETANVVTTVSP
ncbi:MAG: glycogen/starch synthase, partial [Oscillospiraceae bacterium]|nr:glycogen/starch synthase [Oscillospiraceae bacterium]